MGEWSKKIGEEGEELVKEFFELIGWKNSLGGEDIQCFKGERHKTSLNERKSHGIDRLFVSLSPLEDGRLNNLVVSVKHKDKTYPSSPNSLFKKHFLDLTSALECFKHSDLRKRNSESHVGVSNISDVGVLFWITQEDEEGENIVAKLTNCRGLDEFKYETVYLIDNQKAAFIYDTLQYLKLTKNHSKIEFFYPQTGKNINPITRKSSGGVLPVEFINSNVLLLKTDHERKKTLAISTVDRFTIGNLKRLIGLAQVLSSDLSYSIEILFPDYVKNRHENSVKEAKSSFLDIDFTSGIKVASYNADFRGLTNE